MTAPASSKATTTATIKVNVKGQTELTAGEGDGPVDALNSALRKVLRRFYPAIDSVVLEDYHVRILNPESATQATTRRGHPRLSPSASPLRSSMAARS